MGNMLCIAILMKIPYHCFVNGIGFSILPLGGLWIFALFFDIADIVHNTNYSRGFLRIGGYANCI